jgi:hypothetical protein
MPYALQQTFQHKAFQKYNNAVRPMYNPFAMGSDGKSAELFKFDGLSKQGSISRGISFGNSQDVVVNSSLNLQLSGRLGDDIDLVAAVTDENIPFQPDGNTQQIQDFDKVFIQFTRKTTQLRVGDFELRRPDSYFSNYYKKAQGISLSTAFKLGNKNNAPVNRIAVAGAISKGKRNRFIVQGVEGNQGPYRLRGANNESFIIVLSGSEKVYIDGQLMTRGLQNDYVIDYNTAELTFTPKRLITKDSRIVVEFEYSDKNYSRSLFVVNDEFQTNRVKLKFSLYSEQDSPNQPLLQSLSQEQKDTLSAKGDSLQKAVVPSIDSVAFTTDQPLYKKLDTLYKGTSYTIYKYSTNKDSAHFRISFSNVGSGNGDYNTFTSSANGRVFQWVGPGKGQYKTVIQLISPKQQQLFTLGADYKLSKNTQLNTEVALSNNNQNLFSDKDKGDDKGFAFKIGAQNLRALGTDSVNSWKLRSNISLEHTEFSFKPLEKYRSTEFERDWNIGGKQKLLDENIAAVGLELGQIRHGIIGYQLKSYTRGSEYSGVTNSFYSDNNYRHFKLSTNASLLNTKDNNSSNTQFIRHKEELSKAFSHLVLGLGQEQEINSFKLKGEDTLQKNSYSYYLWKAFIASPDTVKNKFRLEYGERTDYTADVQNFKPATLARNVTASTELGRNPNSIFRSLTTFRELDSIAKGIPKQAETSLLNRFEHSLTLFKGVINASTFYEISTGQEVKKYFTYQETARGKGNYIWIDENHNGFKESNEFHTAVYADTARFIKILVPTNDYVKTHANTVNEVLNINPGSIWQNAVGIKGLLGRLSNMFSVQMAQKTRKGNSNDYNYLNPFRLEAADTNLISSQSQIRNTLFINRGRSKVGADFTVSESLIKTLLADGFESRTTSEKGLNLRWDLTRRVNTTLAYRNGLKQNIVEQFISRNYHILYYELEPHLSYQPSSELRITGTYKYSDKTNAVEIQNQSEKAIINKFGLELKYSTLKVGNIQGHIGITKVKYYSRNESEGSSLSYEMLEGLHAGKNLLWGVSIQRNLSNNTQLSINYEGRKSEGVNIIHTGGAQIRAYF